MSKFHRCDDLSPTSVVNPVSTSITTASTETPVTKTRVWTPKIPTPKDFSGLLTDWMKIIPTLQPKMRDDLKKYIVRARFKYLDDPYYENITHDVYQQAVMHAIKRANAIPFGKGFREPHPFPEDFFERLFAYNGIGQRNSPFSDANIKHTLLDAIDNNKALNPTEICEGVKYLERQLESDDPGMTHSDIIDFLRYLEEQQSMSHHERIEEQEAIGRSCNENSATAKDLPTPDLPTKLHS